MKKLVKIILGCILVVIISTIFFITQYQKNIKAVSSNDEKIIFTIENGMGHKEIVNKLYDEGLIKSEFYTEIFLKLNPYPIIQANTYELNKSMSVQEIFDIISSGQYANVVKESFTVIEGSTIPDVAQVISEKIGITTQEVINQWSNKEYLKTLISQYDFLSDEILNNQIKYPLEGYLYPETYDVTGVENTIEAYTKLILDQTNKIIIEYKKQIEDKNMSIHEFLTFASIVERESLFEEDKAKIAGVFYNRLNVDMFLQSDITVLYALGVTKEIVTYNDLEIDSPYNTYKYSGLPVGPISNVYKTTIEACLNPEQHDFYYFFADRNGKVYYSKTLAEHEQISKEYAW